MRTYFASPSEVGRSRYSWGVWWDRPSRWRDEFADAGGEPDVAIVTRRGSLVYLPWQQTMYTNIPTTGEARSGSAGAPSGIMELPSVESRLREVPLLLNSLPHSEWTFETGVRDVSNLGRLAQRIRARRLPNYSVEPDSRPSGYWLGIDEYDCVIDDELQMLLRMTAIVDGESVASLWLDEIVINEGIPDEVFSFAPPPGTRIALAP